MCERAADSPLEAERRRCRGSEGRMQRPDDDHVDQVIDVVRRFLQETLGQTLTHLASPDRNERNATATDAILQGTTGCLIAVEHTSLDSYRGHRRDNARFREVLGQLEEDLRDRLPDHVDVCIPPHAIQPGQDWSLLTRAIRQWLLAQMHSLPYDAWQQVAIPSVSFPVGIRRERCAGPGSLFAMRWAPPNDVLERIQLFIDRIEDKVAVLARYPDDGHRCVLAIESNDFVLVNRTVLWEEFRVAAKNCDLRTVDDVLLVQTSTVPWCVTPLQLDGAITESPRPFWPTAPGYPLAGTQWEQR
jgi:hypothetical protein